MPVVATSAVAWWLTGSLDLLALAFTIGAVFTGALGIHLMIEYTDRKRLQKAHVQPGATALIEFLEREPQVHPGEVRSFALITLLISFVCSLWLGILVGWPMVLFGVASLALGVGYSASPVRYGSWGYGLGESGMFIALGLLPAVSGAYAQVRTINDLALWSGVPFALLVSLVFITYTLLNYRRDWLIQKQTLAVSLGLGRTIDFSTVILIGAFALILLASIVSGLPLRTLLALLGLPIVSGAYSRLDRDNLPPAQGMRLYTSAIHATLVTTLLYALALITTRLW